MAALNFLSRVSEGRQRFFHGVKGLLLQGPILCFHLPIRSLGIGFSLSARVDIPAADCYRSEPLDRHAAP